MYSFIRRLSFEWYRIVTTRCAIVASKSRVVIPAACVPRRLPSGDSAGSTRRCVTTTENAISVESDSMIVAYRLRPRVDRFAGVALDAHQDPSTQTCRDAGLAVAVVVATSSRTWPQG